VTKPKAAVSVVVTVEHEHRFPSSRHRTLGCFPCRLRLQRRWVSLPCMLGTPSIALRLVRSMTALITVWCLGCSSYEPMLGALLGSVDSAGMSCDGKGGMEDQTSSVPESSSDSPSTASVSASTNGSQHSFSCGCQSCQAASPSTLGVASTPFTPPRPPHSLFVNFLSVEREPLVPPPDAVSYRA